MTGLNRIDQVLTLLDIGRKERLLRAEVQRWRLAHIGGHREEAAKYADSIRSILDELHALAATIPEAFDFRYSRRFTWRREWIIRSLVDYLLRKPNDRVLVVTADEESAEEIVQEVKNRLAGTGITPNLRTKTIT